MSEVIMRHPLRGLLVAFCLGLTAGSAAAVEPHPVTLDELEEGFTTAAVRLDEHTMPWCQGRSLDNPVRCWGSDIHLGRELHEVPLVVAANGGGYRAFFFTEGVLMGLDALRLGPAGASAYDEVDAWSTVSGSSLLLTRLLTRRLDLLALDHHELWSQRRSLNVPTFIRTHSFGQSRLLDRREGNRGKQALREFQDDQGPLWVPNASRVPDGLRIPQTCDTVDCEGRRSAALAAFASAAVPGAIAPVRDQKRAMWLMDGAWAERLGLLTALELALGMAVEGGRTPTVLSVDSRPWPQLNDNLRWKGHRFAPIGARIQLVGYAFELLRTHTDRAVLKLAFGDMQPSELEGEVDHALHEEGRDRDPDRYGARAVVSMGEAEVPVLRLGADTLLAPDYWDEAVRDRPACRRIAARLYSAVGVQPTDLKLNAPCYVDEADLPGVERKVYAYESPDAEDYDRADRQAALMLAGLLTVYLQHEQIADALGRDSEQALVWNPLEDGSNTALQYVFDEIDLNFRSWQVANEWNQCLGVRMVRDSPDPGSDSHTIRLGADGASPAGEGYQPGLLEEEDAALYPGFSRVSRGKGDTFEELDCPAGSRSPRDCVSAVGWDAAIAGRGPGGRP